MPSSEQKKRYDDIEYNFDQTETISTSPHITVHIVEGGTDVEIVEEVLVLGKPMVRPPPGWDSRVSNNGVRSLKLSRILCFIFYFTFLYKQCLIILL